MTAAEPLPRPLRAAVVGALCLLLGYAIVAMPLAMLGVLRPLPALLLTLLATAGLLWLARGFSLGGGTARGAVPWARVAGVAVAVLALVSAVVNAHFASEHVMSDRDPGIYVWFGRWLADHGSLLVAKHSHLFAGTGGFEEQCPVTCNAGPGRGFYVQFLHLLPATLAAGAWIGGSALLLKVNAILGGLSLVSFYAFATRFVRPLVAAGATLALALNFAQVYFARDAFSEIIAQLFLFGGLFVLWEARASWDPRRALLGGLLIGATCMARIDSFVYLIPLGAYVAGELALARVRERRRFALAVGGGILATAALGALDLLAFSRGYLKLERSELRAVWIGLAATVLVSVAAIALVRGRPRLRPALVALSRRVATPAAVAIVVLGVFAYLVRPHLGPVTGDYNRVLVIIQSAQGVPLEPRRTYGEQTMVWLAWYLGPVALLAGLGGLALAVREAMLSRRPALVPFAGIAFAISALYIARPSIFPGQVWAMRRFLPVTIPALLVLGAWGADRAGALLAALRPGWLRAPRGLVGAAVPALAIAAAVVLPAWQLAHGLADTREQAGGLQAITRVCKRLPANAVVWTTSGRGDARLIQPIHAFCHVPVAQSLPNIPASNVRRLAERLERRGRQLYLMSTHRDQLQAVLPGPERDERPIVFHPHKLEESVTHRPRHDYRVRLAYYIARP